jgi:hypothetical protein
MTQHSMETLLQQPLEVLLQHPLERLLIKHCGERISNAELGKKMAATSLAVEGYVKGVNCDEEWYAKEFQRRAGNFKITIGKCLKYQTGSSEARPQIETLLLINKAVGCSLDELLGIFYSEYCYLPYGNNGNGNGNSTNRFDSASELEEKSQNEEYDFRIPLILMNVKYTEQPNTLIMQKTYRLKSLKEDLQSAVKLSHYKCIRKKKPKIEVSDSLNYDIEEGVNEHENYITIRFKKPLAKNEEIEFTIFSEYCDLEDDEIKFHYTLIQHPTDLLILNIIPPNIERDTHAKYYVCQKKDDYWDMIQEASVEYSENLNDILLAFHKVILNPDLEQTYGFRWLEKDSNSHLT